MYFVLSFILYFALFLEKFTPLAKNFTLPPAVTALTNITSDCDDNDQNYGFKVSLARRSLVRSGDNLMLSDFQMGSNTDFDFSHIGKGFFFSLHLFRVISNVSLSETSQKQHVFSLGSPWKIFNSDITENGCS